MISLPSRRRRAGTDQVGKQFPDTAQAPHSVSEPLQPRHLLGEQLLGQVEVAEAVNVRQSGPC
ncbi:hypothetical protein ACFVYE_33245 [Streptomyces sp. NPDC058239]|uniref:hypothetical protein n=1 Tax=Streptomyces sp. NPDC058239 TaxID=3346395 RepID=UPI0036EB66E0